MRKRSKSLYVSKKELEDCDLYHASEEEEIFTENLVERHLEADGWSPEEEILLLNEIQKMIPKPDEIPYDERWKKIDWTKINIKTFTGDEVKSRFSIMLENSRTFRLLGEILVDLRRELFGKLNVQKPTSPFGIFLLENSNELKQACHDQGHNYLQLASELYRKLSPEELEKYKEKSIKRRNEYNLIMGKLCVDEWQTKIVTNDPKLEGPISIFYRSKKLKGEKVKLADIKREYKGLPKDEKLAWILKWASVNQGEKFSKDQYELAKKTLTKLDMEIIDEYEGKPQRNLSAFLCYVKEFTSKFRDSNEKHVYQKAVDSWKNLSLDEKQIYQERIKQDKKDYKKELKSYYNSLPADRRSQNYSKTDKKTKVSRSSKNQNIETPKENEISLDNEVLKISRKSIRRKLEMSPNDDETGEKPSKKSKKQKLLTDLLPIKTKTIGWEKTLDEGSKVLENEIKEENESQNENLLSSSKVTKRKVKNSSLVQKKITDDLHYNGEEQPINVDICNYNDEEITNKTKKKKKKNKDSKVLENEIKEENESQNENLLSSSKVRKRKVKNSSLVQKKITDDLHYNDEHQPINVDIYDDNYEEITDKNKKKMKKKNKEVPEVSLNVDNYSGCEEITESISKKIEKLLLRKPPRSTFGYFAQKIYTGPSKKAKKNFLLLTPTEKEAIVIQHNRAKQKFLKRVQKFGNSLKPHEFEENEQIIQEMLLDRDDEQSDISNEGKS